MSAQLLFNDVELPVYDVGSKLTFKPLRNPLWTENKAKLIAAYLRYFVFITKHGAYIDGFTGPQEPDKLDTWAAKLVLENDPKWFRSFYFCELSKARIKQIERLKAEQPPVRNRTIDVYQGDFNTVIDEVLRQPGIGAKVATFCLLDQRTFECNWASVQKIAAHKPDNKIEIFYFLGTSWLDRAISAIKDKNELVTWWGNDGWTQLKGLKAHQRSDIMCERFRTELGYKYANGWPIMKDRHDGKIMYYMIHASDHDDAALLMHRAYRFATGMLPPQSDAQFELQLPQPT